MSAVLATVWIGFWASGVVFAVGYENFDLELTAAFSGAAVSIGAPDAPDQSMQCIMLHTVWCAPMIAYYLSAALRPRPNAAPSVAVGALVFLNLFVVIGALIFFARPLYAYDGRDVLSLFVDATSYGGFFSATVLLLVRTMIDMARRL